MCWRLLSSILCLLPPLSPSSIHCFSRLGLLDLQPWCAMFLKKGPSASTSLLHVISFPSLLEQALYQPNYPVAIPFAVKNKDILLCAKWGSNVSAGEDWVGLGQHQQTNFRPLPSLLITNNVLDPAPSTALAKIRKNTGESLEVRSDKRKQRKETKKEIKREERETKERQWENREIRKILLVEMLETIDILAEILNIWQSGPVVAHHHYKSSCWSEQGI